VKIQPLGRRDLALVASQVAFLRRNHQNTTAGRPPRRGPGRPTGMRIGNPQVGCTGYVSTLLWRVVGLYRVRIRNLSCGTLGCRKADIRGPRAVGQWTKPPRAVFDSGAKSGGKVARHDWFFMLWNEAICLESRQGAEQGSSTQTHQPVCAGGMIDDMRMRKVSDKTQHQYLRDVSQFDGSLASPDTERRGSAPLPVAYGRSGYIAGVASMPR